MRSLPDELKRAKDFHSHLGPYLVVGLKMGQGVVEKLGNEPFSTIITVFTGVQPPLSCVVDGIQLSTPCTVGNGGIRIQEGGQVRIQAVREAQTLDLSLKPEIWGQIQAAEGTEGLEELAVKLWEMKAAELLDVIESEP
jgi:formylmethanofuran dehydrogenase subunit E